MKAGRNIGDHETLWSHDRFGSLIAAFRSPDSNQNIKVEPEAPDRFGFSPFGDEAAAFSAQILSGMKPTSQDT